MRDRNSLFLFISKKTALSLLVLSVFFLTSLFVPNEVFASTGLYIQPVKVSHTLNPGESVTDTIILTNASDEDIKVEASVEDFVPAAGSINLEFVGRAPGVTTVRDWITIGGKDSFVFKKGESRKIPYTIKAPPSAEPGGHFGVAFFKASRLEEAGQLKISTRVGMLIFVTVPGSSLQKGKILDFSAPFFSQKSPIPFTLTFENTGTVHFEPKGIIAITNTFGKKVGEVPISGQVVLPSGVRDLTAEWRAPKLLVGRYSAAVIMSDGEGNELTAKTISFFVFPLGYLVGFIALLIALFFGIKFIKNKVRISIVK